MSAYLFDPPPVVAVPVDGEDRPFPVRRILCVGRNYAAHRREMGGDDRDPPFFFAKPADAIVGPGRDAAYPSATQNLHHEIELVVALKAGGANVPVDKALDLILGYAVGVDLTRRDLQNAAKKEGKPWDMGKGFDYSAPIGLMVPASKCGHPAKGLIELKVNGKVRQTSDLSKMIWNIPETIAYLSRLVRLAPGDLIYTGTPENVAAVQRGDLLEGVVEGVGSVRTRIV